MDIERLAETDLPAVMRIQESAYGIQYLECAQSFASKMKAFPFGCFGAYEAGQLRGYAVTLPWRSGEIIPLNALSIREVTNPDCIYIHDVAVSPSFCGRGIAKKLLVRVLEMALERTLVHAMLVAVQGSESYWSAMGFVPLTAIVYVGGSAATVMRRRIDY